MPTESFFTQSSLAYIASAGAGKDGKAYSIRPTDSTGDFTFLRGSNLAATRVDAAGLIEKGRENLLTQSNRFDLWNLENVTSGHAGYDGTNDAYLQSGTSRLQRTISYGSGVYTASVFVKAGFSNYVQFRIGSSSTVLTRFELIGNGTILGDTGTFYKSIEPVSGATGWYRISISFNSNATQFRIDPENDSGGTQTTDSSIYIQDAQLEVGLAATEYIESGATKGTAGILEQTPRFGYSNGASCPSLLLEPSRTNAFANSEYFGSWNSSGGTLTANSTNSPEGLKNAYLYTEDTSTNYHRFATTASATNSNKVFTVYAKLADGAVNKFLTLDNGPTAWFDLENGTIGSTQGSAVISMESVGNGWYRCIYHNPASSNGGLFIGIAPSNNGLGNHTGSGQPAFYAFGAQCEDNVVYPTSYIPTYGTSVTRAADSCNGAGNADTFNSTEGVLYAEFSGLVNAEDYRIISLNAGDSANSIFIGIRNDTGNVYMYMPLDGTSYISSVNATNTNVKVALKYKTNDVSFYINGVKVFSDSSVTLPVGLSKLDFNYGNVSNSYPFYGNVKQLLVFNTALSDADLATLTTI